MGEEADKVQGSTEEKEEVIVEDVKGTDIGGLSREELVKKVNEEGAVYGDYVDYKKESPKGIIDWFLDNQEKVSSTDIVRKWVFASIPCKICGRKPEELVDPGEAMYVISFLNFGTDPGRAIRFFCRDHAQLLQDELVSRGIEIITEEQRRELLEKLDIQFAAPDESMDKADESAGVAEDTVVDE